MTLNFILHTLGNNAPCGARLTWWWRLNWCTSCWCSPGWRTSGAVWLWERSAAKWRNRRLFAVHRNPHMLAQLAAWVSSCQSGIQRDSCRAFLNFFYIGVCLSISSSPLMKVLLLLAQAPIPSNRIEGKPLERQVHEHAEAHGELDYVLWFVLGV